MDFHTKNIHQGCFNEVLKKIFELGTDEVKKEVEKITQ